MSASHVEASTPAIFSADAEASSKSTPTSTREIFATTVGKSPRTPKGFRQSVFQLQRIRVESHAPCKQLSGRGCCACPPRMTKPPGPAPWIV